MCEREILKRMCEREIRKRPQKFRWDRAMNLKCKQRQYITVGQNLPMRRMDKCQKRLSRKTVKFQVVWSYSRSYLPAHSYVLCTTKVPWSRRMECEYLTDLWQIALFYFLVLTPDKGKRNHYWACLISALPKNWILSEFWLCATPLFKCKMESIDIFLGRVLDDKDDI